MPPSTVLVEPSACDRAAPGPGDVEGDVGGERRLAHGRAAGEDDEVRRLQPAHQPVEIVEAGGEAREMPVALIGGARHVDRGEQRRLEGMEAAIVVADLGELEEPLLRLLDLVARAPLDRRVIGVVDHVLADEDERAAEREVVDGAAVVLGVDDGRRFRGETGEILREVDLADGEFGRQEGL